MTRESVGESCQKIFYLEKKEEGRISSRLNSYENRHVVQVVLTGNFDECVLSDAIIFEPPLLYKSLGCSCCIMVGEGETPVDPGIIDGSIMLPFIA